MSKETNKENEINNISEKSIKKSQKKVAKILLSTALVLIVISIIYVGFAYYYESVIFPRTKINGIDCSELSVEQAERMIKEKVEDYALELTFRDDSENVIDGKEIDYEYVSKGDVQKILDEQNPWEWIVYIFKNKEYHFEESIQYDAAKLLNKFYNLNNINGNTQISPENACVVYKENSFVIVPENEGNKIKKNELYSAVRDAISNSETSMNVEELSVYEEPEVRQDSPMLKQECDQLNELASVSITYELPDGEKVLDGNEVRKWLVLDEEGNYTVDDKELKASVTTYVSDLAKEVNTAGTAREFHSTKRGTLEVSGGSYGYKINQKAEVQQILDEIAAHEIVTREPNYTSIEVTDEANGLGDTYVEIDLSAQHLWYYIDGKLYVESDLVSGTYTVPSRKTPAGVYLLSYKQKNAVLRGALKEDGTYEYESPVNFWMPFNRGIGMHDANWRGSFGGSIFKYSGSHGCINLPYEKAKAIYGKIDKETPIILYY